ncbi:hypothetical protein P9B03_07535 [Metasolibacillus meyeri]|uniref:Lipoprotein n=1 Tax=Metasolibacillus meyeri TaxID=1071052 RepID=A0AAW9NSJ1_9BACL|nr:hypothetical protein [Metasolibacillus meyeri]MEC1178329.1 hypothetical protein [Metasolibacillus meyeri]
MKKWLFILFSCCVLIGCQQERVEEVEKEPYAFYEHNKKPREIYLQEGELTKEISYTVLNQHCWNADLSQCSSELKELPSRDIFGHQQEPKFQPNTMVTIMASANEDITLSEEEQLPYPTTIEAFQIVDETLVPVTTLQGNELTLPNEAGVYTYVFKITFDEHYKGIAFYSWRVRVEE